MATRFARSGTTSPLGKVGKPLGQLRLHDEAESLVRRAAAKSGLPVLEFVRQYIEQGFLGRAEIERRHTMRLDAIEVVLPKGSEKVRE